MTEHPIAPPPELVDLVSSGAEAAIATKILQWAAPILRQQGADQELEACCAELPGLDDYLRAARRPKLWSLKEQALEALQNMNYMNQFPNEHDYNTIRQALEALPND